MARRIAFVLLSALAGMTLFLRGEAPTAPVLIAGFAIGAVTGGLILVAEYLLQQTSFGIIAGGTAGLAIGLVLTGLVEWVGSVIFDVETFLFHIGGLMFLLGLPYLGLMLGAKFGRERITGQPKHAEHAVVTSNHKILDTSVIIDGRVADLCETGFLEGTFLVPQFILHELQHIADSSDSLKRARGRRGLDILNKIQKMVDIDVRIIDDDFPNVKDVDSKLVVLAKKVGAKVITNDLNLNKVAELQGVRVLNINELCNALRPVVLPGETIRVFVLKEGKEAGQGVAYLDDGTMIVVDNAKRCIGRNVDVVVTSVLQTTAGRMIFTRLREETEKEEFQVARG
ncbi:MAG: TRAM domain-containing protein [Nitrospirota bacterium]|nr:TRAM domain-containing protein [Nitrospirota bacterium]MDE3034820.1 TRAM domain-containing protein [Nitrospirota bacterium]MDE3117797.1 TRAM domain-containing protein [Nitrospirota bacterium]MDE3224685.1 TRAM domain-containing protein [Nitrospirota bacterium]MDE3243574.1 TRAM domain-containing protein [Nitrospirota bacterium]